MSEPVHPHHFHGLQADALGPSLDGLQRHDRRRRDRTGRGDGDGRPDRDGADQRAARRGGAADDAIDPDDFDALQELGRAAALCNDAVLVRTDAGWSVEGDPMEGGLLAHAGKLSGEGADPYPGWKRWDAIPFDAAHRYMAVLVRDAGGHATVQVKGAPEAIIGMCADQRAADGGTARLDPDHWHDLVQRLAADGQRVLALATRSADAEMTTLETPDLEGRLILIGLVGLIDPPRAETIEAVADCHAAGIRLKMITGDHAATARAIAARIGLKNTDSVLTGNDLEAMDDAPPAATAGRPAVERNPDLADPPGLGALRGGGVRHVPLRDQTGVSRRTRTDYGAQHAGRARDLLPLLHSQPPRHVAHPCRRARDPGGLGQRRDRTVAQLAVTYLPPLQAIFGTQSVPLAVGVLVIGVGVVFFALIETEKQMRLALRT
jgi:hypothetical protein